jgi:predicted transcriptional regulator
MRKDVKEQQDRTENLRLEAIEREERMRERFEVVIQGLQEDKDQLVQQLEIRLTQVESKMEVLASQVRKLFAVVTKTKV